MLNYEFLIEKRNRLLRCAHNDYVTTVTPLHGVLDTQATRTPIQSRFSSIPKRNEGHIEKTSGCRSSLYGALFEV